MEYSYQKQYQHLYSKIEEQPVEESFCLYEGTNTIAFQEEQVHDISFECTHPFQIATVDEYPSQLTYQEEVEQTTKSYTQITGIHEKYLNESTSPLPKKMHQSGRKVFTAQKYSLYAKKTKKNKKETLLDEKNINLNPLSQGLQGLRIDHQELMQTLREMVAGGEQQKNAVFLQLGLKMPKSLGKGRAERDLQAILSFLQKGELCPEYVEQFMVLLGS